MTLGFSVLLIMLGHVLADFYAQGDRVAQGKAENRRLLAVHCALYAACLAPFCLFSFSLCAAIAAWLVLSFSHGLIDCCKVAFEKRNDPPFAAFCIDQTAHVLICLVVALAFGGGSPVLDIMTPLINLMGFGAAAAVLSSALSLLVVWRPAALFVSFMLRSVRIGPSSETDEGAEELRAGRWIGVLERTIIAVLTLCGQFTAIAFVLTAKSIARFKMLDNQKFAECYLVGTLASAALAIMVPLAVGAISAWAAPL